MHFPLEFSHQIMRVISSPSRSTTGFLTTIFLAPRAVVVLAKLRVCCPETRVAPATTADDDRIVDHPAALIAAPDTRALDMALFGVICEKQNKFVK